MKKLVFRSICLVLAVMLMFTGCGNKGNSSDVTEGNSQSGNQNSVEGDNEPVTDVMARTDYQFINAYGYSASTSVRVDFGVINNCNLYAPGDEVTYFINISGKNLDGKAAKVNFFHKNFGVSKTFEHTIATDEKGKQTITGKLTTEKTYKNGVYTFECTVDGFDKELKFDIGIVPRAARANDDFYYGVQSYITRSKNTASHRLTHQGADDTTVSKFVTADYMGCNMIREEVTNFGGMWSKKEDKIDPSVIESDIEIADKLGMTYLWLATGSPAWAIDSKYTDSEYQGWQLPPDADVWKKYINAIGKYYKDYDNIIFEIWNEADWEFFMGTKEDYFNLLDIAIKELTSVSNKIRILPSACVSGWELSKDGATHSKGRSFYFGHYLKYIKDGSLLGLNYHDHQLFNQKLINDYKKTADSALSDVISLGYTEAQFQGKWVTESGVWGKSGSELHRAQTLTNKMLFYRATGAKSFVTWEFNAQTGSDSAWALLSDTLEPQVGVIAWTYQVGLLGNAKLKQHIAAPSGAAFADVYYDGKKTIVPFYSYADATDYMTVKGAHKVYDMCGNEMSATGDYEGSKSCMYIVFDGQVDSSAFSLSAL